MNPEFPTDPRQALEPSLTALVLGELPEDQAHLVRQAIANDPELAKTFERIKQTTSLIQETGTPATDPMVARTGLKLSDERRQQLLQRFKTVQPEQFQRRSARTRSWLVPVAASIAFLLVLTLTFLPGLTRSKNKSLAQLENMEPAFRRRYSPATKGADSASPDADWKLSTGRTAPLGYYDGYSKNRLLTSTAQPQLEQTVRQSIVLPTGGKPEQTAAEGKTQVESRDVPFGLQPQSAPAAIEPNQELSYFDSNKIDESPSLAASGNTFSTFSAITPTMGDARTLGRSFSYQKEDNAASTGIADKFGDTSWAFQEQGSSLGKETRAKSAESVGGRFGGFALAPAQQAQSTTTSESAAKQESTLALNEQLKDVPTPAPLPALRSELTDQLKSKQNDVGLADGSVLHFNRSRQQESLPNGSDSVKAAVGEADKKLSERATDLKAGLDDREELLKRRNENTAKATPSNVIHLAQLNEKQVDAAKVAPQVWEPQPEVQTKDNPFSTFSLNVSDVSFKLAGASLDQGKLPDPTTIRSEEFINAFGYRDPEPAAGQPVAFAWDRARYPFAQSRELLRFSIKTASAGRQAGKPLNLVLLLDNSGSMERPDRVQIIHEAIKVLASQLQASDTLSVVIFARSPRLWVDGITGDQAARVADDLSSLTPEGGTNLEEALNLAYQTALRHYLASGINRVVLLTDGAANLGDTSAGPLKQKVESYRKQGVALDGFGIGWEGYNDDLLEALTRNGDGRYGFLNSPEEATADFAGQLAGALHVAASDVKVQVEFNPRRVTSYRQIGYARHQLTKEQFRDNTVDAAELGAAEAGNAAYVAETNPQGDGPIAMVRVRYRTPGTSDVQEHEWTVPYQGQALSMDQADPAMRLAGSATAFSEWLASSPFATEVTLDRLLSWLKGVTPVYGADSRPQKLESMIRQAKAISGK
jgi:Mg-chelatase subunit ChlD